MQLFVIYIHWISHVDITAARRNLCPVWLYQSHVIVYIVTGRKDSAGHGIVWWQIPALRYQQDIVQYTFHLDQWSIGRIRSGPVTCQDSKEILLSGPLGVFFLQGGFKPLDLVISQPWLYHVQVRNQLTVLGNEEACTRILAEMRNDLTGILLRYRQEFIVDTYKFQRQRKIYRQFTHIDAFNSQFIMVYPDK